MNASSIRVWTFQFTDEYGRCGLLTHEHHEGRSYLPVFPSKMLADMELEDEQKHEDGHHGGVKLSVVEIEVMPV